MNRLLAEVAIGAFLALALWFTYGAWQDERVARKQAEANYEAEKANVKIVEKQVIVEVAAEAAVPVVRGNLERVCVIPAVADPGVPAAPADAEARDVLLDRLSREIPQCLSEGERLVAAAEAARNAGCLR